MRQQPYGRPDKQSEDGRRMERKQPLGEIKVNQTRDRDLGVKSHCINGLYGGKVEGRYLECLLAMLWQCQKRERIGKVSSDIGENVKSLGEAANSSGFLLSVPSHVYKVVIP